MPATALVDALGRPEVSGEIRTAIDNAFKALPEHKRGAVLVIADEHGARGQLAARFGDSWKVAAGAGFDFGEKRPAGYVAVEYAF